MQGTHPDKGAILLSKKNAPKLDNHTVRNIKPEIHRLDLMYEDLDFKYQHNLHDTLLGLKVPTVGFGNPKLSCVKIRSESKSNTLFTLTI